MYNCDDAYIKYNNSSYPLDTWLFEDGGKGHIFRVKPNGMSYMTVEGGVYTTNWNYRLEHLDTFHASYNGNKNIWIMFVNNDGTRLLLQAQPNSPQFGYYEYVNGNWAPIWTM